MTAIGQPYHQISQKTRFALICGTGTIFAVLLAIIVILALLLGARSGQTKITLHDKTLKYASSTNETVADLSRYDKGLELDFTTT